MAQAIRGKIPVTTKVVFELRYRQGYTYLDRCGRTINLIQEYYPDWIVPGIGPNPHLANLVNVETGAKFNFSSAKMDLSLDRPSREGDLDDAKILEFASQAEELTSIAIDQLGLADFSRIGCRVWYLFAADTENEAREYLDSLRLCTIPQSLPAAFGGEQEAFSLAVIIGGKDRKFRVAFEVVERSVEIDLGDAVVNIPIHLLPSHRAKGQPKSTRQKALIDREKAASRKKKYPPYAAAIDVDAYRESPEVVKPEEFITTGLELAGESIRAIASNNKVE